MAGAEGQMEDGGLTRRGMGARMGGNAANARRSVQRGEPAFDGSQRSSNSQPPARVSPPQETQEIPMPDVIYPFLDAQGLSAPQTSLANPSCLQKGSSILFCHALSSALQPCCSVVEVPCT